MAQAIALALGGDPKAWAELRIKAGENMNAVERDMYRQETEAHEQRILQRKGIVE
jgi:hypothetical protein